MFTAEEQPLIAGSDSAVKEFVDCDRCMVIDWRSTVDEVLEDAPRWLPPDSLRYEWLDPEQTQLKLILAIETARDSEWFSPFFAAHPELQSGQFISGRDVLFGYVVTLEASGTGAFRTHHLFDLRQPHPRIVNTVTAGRIRRSDFDTDAEYEQALK